MAEWRRPGARCRGGVEKTARNRRRRRRRRCVWCCIHFPTMFRRRRGVCVCNRCTIGALSPYAGARALSDTLRRAWNPRGAGVCTRRRTIVVSKTHAETGQRVFIDPSASPPPPSVSSLYSLLSPPFQPLWRLFLKAWSGPLCARRRRRRWRWLI